MSYSYQVRTTSELSAGDLAAMSGVFQAAFGKARCPESMRSQYVSAKGGDSIHAVLVHETLGLVGCTSAFPAQYRVFGEERVLALSLDTMIHPEHRTHPLHLKRLFDLLESALRDRGIEMIFGFPNDQSIRYLEKVMGWKRIGELAFRVLPLRLGMIHPGLAFLNGPWYAFLKAICRLIPVLPFRGRSLEPGIIRHREPTSTSYGVAQGRVLRELPSASWTVYSVHQELEGARIAYMVDAVPLTPRTLRNAVLCMLEEPLNADILAYVGTLPFSTMRLIRVPASKVPRPLRLSGKILLHRPHSGRMLEFSSWHVNLSDFDVR